MTSSPLQILEKECHMSQKSGNVGQNHDDYGVPAVDPFLLCSGVSHALNGRGEVLTPLKCDSLVKE